MSNTKETPVIKYKEIRICRPDMRMYKKLLAAAARNKRTPGKEAEHRLEQSLMNEKL